MMTTTMTIALMSPPYEAERTTTAFRLMDAALRQGHTLKVFAYEGAVSLTMAEQAPHPNPVKGTSVEEEAHPTTKEWVGELFRSYPDQLEWVNCGLCVDERGAGNWIDGPRRGGPKDFADMVLGTDTTLIIPAK
ncbi:MAG: DsrE family protein [Actinomycetota bacterium]|nr:DsrE family protein [Actinomycetota bacterium]